MAPLSFLWLKWGPELVLDAESRFIITFYLRKEKIGEIGGVNLSCAQIYSNKFDICV